MARDKFDYSHGDSGNQPPDGNEFAANERPDAQHFDWWWTNVLSKINKLWDEFSRIDSDDDGVVDEADYAQDADASTYKGNDLDSDGDGIVDNADRLDGFEASELSGGGGGFTLTGFALANGNYHPIARFAAGDYTTLDISKYTLVNESFDSPTGLSVVVYDMTNNTELARYTGTGGSLSDSFDITSEDIVIAVDNGSSQFGYTGTGSEQQITASLNAQVN